MTNIQRITKLSPITLLVAILVIVGIVEYWAQSIFCVANIFNNFCNVSIDQPELPNQRNFGYQIILSTNSATASTTSEPMARLVNV